jgi:hypothetical protein
MRQSMVCSAGLALALVGVSACAPISVTTGRSGEILICDGTWQQHTMFGSGSGKQHATVYPNPDPTKIRVRTGGLVEGVCVNHEGATCQVSIKGKTLIVSSTFPGWMGTQTFTFDADTAHMTFGTGGLDGGAGFSGTCQRKTD